MAAIISVEDLHKTYDGGFQALKGAKIDIEEGEILALLGPNGAGKTTLISIVCGLTTMTSGKASVGGFDVVKDFKQARRLIGLVPQEINLEPFEKVQNVVGLSRGLFGLPRNDGKIEEVLRRLSLWDKRGSPTGQLSGGMRRRVLIAKALVHDPKVLFLDEPTAGVDVELRKEMWAIVRDLKAQGVTIILTTHYIEEAEAIADRVAVISEGDILLVEDTETLMRRMGQKEMSIELQDPVDQIPGSLAEYDLQVTDDRCRLLYRYDTGGARTGITKLLSDLASAGLILRDVQTRQSSLEDIFVQLLKEKTS